MENKKSLLIFAPEYAQLTRRFSNEEKGIFFDAVLDYVSFGFEPNFENQMKIAFEFIKKRIEDTNLKYQEKCSKNKENGKKGGRPKTESKPKKTERLEKQNRTQTETNPNDNDNDIKEKKTKQDKSCFEKEKPKIKLEDVSDWDDLFAYWEQNKQGGKYKNQESRTRMLDRLKELTSDNFELAKEAIVFCIDNKYQGFTDGSRLYYRSSEAACGRKTQSDEEFYRKLEAL